LALNLLLAALLGAVLAVAPATVTAHSLLLEASPAADALLSGPPTEIALRFNNRVEKRLCTILLVDARGESLRAEVRIDGPADRLNAPAPALGPGTWRLEWRVLSTDGHVVTGRYSFRIAP
jgi:copper resistance protein C